MLVLLVIIVFWLIVFIGAGVVLGFVVPVFKNTRVYLWAVAIYLIIYLILVILEIQIGLMIPFIVAVALFINLSRFLSQNVEKKNPIRVLALLTVLGSSVLMILYMGFFGRSYSYPAEEKYRVMAEEGYSNLSVQNPILKLFTTHYHAKVYLVEDHCPIPKNGKNPNRDYVIATYQKAFGLTQKIMYHDCGYGKFWHSWPKPEWELSKDKLVAES